jgi:hypothetical protein
MKGNAEVCGRRRHLTRMYRRPGGLAALTASAAPALAACGGSSTSQIASLGTSSGSGTGSGSGSGSGSVPATQPAGVAPLLNEWGARERSDQAGPERPISAATAAAVQRQQKTAGLCGS